MTKKEEQDYYELYCGGKEQADEVVAWAKSMHEQGIDFTIGDLLDRFPHAKLSRNLPQSAREFVAYEGSMFSQTAHVNRVVSYTNIAVGLFFGFGSTAALLLSRYWLYPETETTLWLVENWWLWVVWAVCMAFSVWIYPKD